MSGKYVKLLESILSGDYEVRPHEPVEVASEANILKLILKDVEKNGPAVEFDKIAFATGTSQAVVENVAAIHRDEIQKAISNHPHYQQTNWKTTHTDQGLNNFGTPTPPGYAEGI